MDAEEIAKGLTERDKWFLINSAPCRTGELWTPVSVKYQGHRLTDGGVVNNLGLSVRAILKGE